MNEKSGFNYRWRILRSFLGRLSRRVGSWMLWNSILGQVKSCIYNQKIIQCYARLCGNGYFSKSSNVTISASNSIQVHRITYANAVLDSDCSCQSMHISWYWVQIMIFVVFFKHCINAWCLTNMMATTFMKSLQWFLDNDDNHVQLYREICIAILLKYSATILMQTIRSI